MKYCCRIGISAFLAVSVLTSMAMTSCGSGDDTAFDTVSVTIGDTTPAAETEPTREQHKVPADALDFDGEELNQASFTWQGYKFYFFADEENGDVMNDALYARNLAVEEALNIKIETEQFSTAITYEFVNAVKPLILAGDDVYDLMFNHCIDGISTYASEGYLYNLDRLPHIDMDAAWWNKEQMDVLRLGQNTYYAVNDMMIPCPYVIFFNKEMVKNFDMDDPYQLVYDGKWTLDRYEEMARAAVSDLNGDGKMTKEDDSWGMNAQELSKYISFMAAADQFITDRDTDGRIRLAFNTEKTQSMMERFAAMSKDNVILVVTTDVRSDMLTLDTGRIMFQLDPISEAELLRDCPVEFGFLPYPKFDEAQADYISLDWGGLLSVPCTITNPDMVGAAMELLAWESANDVIPTYYDTVLQGKLARDDDAIRMMDILFDTIAYEIGGNYFGFSVGFSDLFYALPLLAVQRQSSDFASYYQKLEKTASKTIEKFYNSLENTEAAND